MHQDPHVIVLPYRRQPIAVVVLVRQRGRTDGSCEAIPHRVVGIAVILCRVGVIRLGQPIQRIIGIRGRPDRGGHGRDVPHPIARIRLLTHHTAGGMLGRETDQPIAVIVGIGRRCPIRQNARPGAAPPDRNDTTPPHSRGSASPRADWHCHSDRPSPSSDSRSS